MKSAVRSITPSNLLTKFLIPQTVPISCVIVRDEGAEDRKHRGYIDLLTLTMACKSVRAISQAELIQGASMPPTLVMNCPGNAVPRTLPLPACMNITVLRLDIQSTMFFSSAIVVMILLPLRLLVTPMLPTQELRTYD